MAVKNEVQLAQRVGLVDVVAIGVGAAIGGVAGGVGSVVQRGDQVEIPSEAQLEFHLTQPVMLPVAQ